VKKSGAAREEVDAAAFIQHREREEIIPRCIPARRAAGIKNAATSGRRIDAAANHRPSREEERRV